MASKALDKGKDTMNKDKEMAKDKMNQRQG
jgi:hypothetical protein